MLAALLPRALTEEEVVEALGDVSDAIRAAKGDGPAMGIAMKALKSTGASVEAPTVGAAVRRIRAQ